MQSKWVRLGSVRRFDHVKPDKTQALKPLEEAAEVFGAWQDTHLPEDRRREKVLAECADVIQAALNFVAAYGVDDFRPWMKACELRNRARGRITDGRPGDGE